MAQVLESPENVSIANGAVASFATIFTFEHAAEVRVTVDSGEGPVPQTNGEHYDLTGGDWLSAGANVVFRPAHLPPAGAKVGRQRVTLAIQPEPFGDLEAFRPLQSEVAYDRLTRGAQDARAVLERSIAVGLGETAGDLPGPAQRLNRIYVGGGSGEPLKLLDGSEQVVTLNAAGEAVPMDLIHVFGAIGTDLFDDGQWEPSDNPSSNDDGVWG